MTYPDTGSKSHYFSATDPFPYLEQYADCLRENLKKIEPGELENAVRLIESAASRQSTLYVAGNGGSFAIAQHLCCDWMKGTRVGKLPVVRVEVLGVNQSLMTALANDFGYAESYAAELDMLAKEGDIAILVSSSGDSSNIVRTAEIAKEKGMPIIGMTGFDGGRLHQMADIKFHIPIKNYGIVEDCHQMLMHVIAQYVYLSRK